MTADETTVPFLDLTAQYQSLRDELDAAVLGVLRSGQYVLGPRVEAFEDALAAYCGARNAVAVSSGTSALHLALLAAGIGAGDEVITVPMTFVATVAAILYAGATPRFVDIDPATWAMDVRKLEAAVTARTKAIIPVHLHGRMADMDPVLEIARRHGLRVIEDAAQALGAEYAGRRAGTVGDLGCFSFYPGKNLGGCGEGGGIVTDNDGLARQLRMLRDWGQSHRYAHVVKGFNYRMDAVQGAVLAVKLRHLDDWIAARRHVAGRYTALLGSSAVGLPAAGDPSGHVWHVYAVRVKSRDQVQRSLAQKGVSTGIHYPVPVHLQPAYADLGYRAGDFPVAEAFSRETLSLPLYPEMSQAHIERVVTALRAAALAESSHADAA